jgi:hypothetical protein
MLAGPLTVGRVNALSVTAVLVAMPACAALKGVDIVLTASDPPFGSPGMVFVAVAAVIFPVLTE